MRPDSMQLFVFSASLVVAALVGGLFPWWGKLRPDRIPPLVSASAGILLGTSIFHLLPDAYASLGLATFLWCALGFFLLYFLEKLLRGYGHGHGHVHGEDHDHTHGHEDGHNPPASALAAFVGLALHSFFDGLALGASSESTLQQIVFIALFAHKAPTAFSLSSILRLSGVSFRKGLLFLLSFAFSIPLGVLAMLFLPSAAQLSHLEAYALAFSAGNFFHVAFDDLLPEVGREAKDVRAAVLGFVIGFLLPLLAVFLHVD